jgi:predicted Holliday junction resolvase-like endonuclease|tara:strand:+ start:3285 stop:3704 length:420 start_codon:yes stop_codon:yes gene_type:complete
MSWLATKTFFKKAWALVCKYWQYVALAFYTIIVAALLRDKKSVGNIKAAFKASKDSHKKELEAIDNAHKEELVKRDKIIDDYHATTMKLDDEYKKQNLKLHEWEKKKIKKIVEETHNDPEGRVKKISEEFGFELVTVDE